jgi:exopolyphosphatase/guanosine-5'-triphosphate,3'-diphosphate pyrophosphatase
LTVDQRGPAAKRAIIDIGSNTVRLVVYAGPRRAPVPILNEKVTAGLGGGVAATGMLSDDAVRVALSGLRRYAMLLDLMQVAEVRTVATAAARDAGNGAAFLDRVRAIGLSPELLTGEQEALASAGGILSAFPDADGVMGDLGGGSLELVEIARGRTSHAASFPLGTLRLPTLRQGGMAQAVEKMLRHGGWQGAAAGRSLYMVGGSWRALAHLDMHMTGFPIPVAHGYTMTTARIDAVQDAVATLGPRGLKAVPGLSGTRIPALADAAELLGIVARRLQAARLVLSGYGLREGLLLQMLDAGTRAQDPLMVAAHDHDRQRGTAEWDVLRLDAWIAPLFAGETAADARLRRAACVLSGADLHADADARPRQGMELALLGNWTGIDVAERAMLAQALWAAAGGKGVPATVAALADAARLRQAGAWGQAMRLAHRFGGGSTRVLDRAGLSRADGLLTLSVEAGAADLYGEVVRKHHLALAETLALRAVLAEA